MAWPDIGSLPAPAAITAYSVAFFISLAVLAWGADLFVDEAADVAQLAGISPVLIGLLTAGAEWEELFVVTAAILQKNPSLAIGNIIGSAISNILGAFSLGLLFKKGDLEFDGSAKFYALVLFAITAIVTPLTQAQLIPGARRVFGICLLFLFVIYLGTIGLAIRQGHLAAIEDSDDDDADSDDEDENARLAEDYAAHEIEPLIPARSGREPAIDRTSLSYHILWLLIGLLAVVLSSPVLAATSQKLAAYMNISDTLFGVVFLSIATTVPEKVIAVFSGFKGQGGMLAATTVGSDIFLLTLCLGVLWTSVGKGTIQQDVNLTELAVLIASTGLLAVTMWHGEWAKVLGAGMLGCYIAFLALEFTVLRNSD